MRAECGKCKKLLIAPFGPPSSKVLLVGEYPGKDEVIKGVPFVGKVGDILKAETVIAGLDIWSFRLTNLWQHYKDEKACSVDIHSTALAKEMKGKEFVLLMGTDVTKLLFNAGVQEISGLEMKHELFPKTRIFIAPHPAQLLHGPIGEFRLAMSRFANAVNQ